VEGALAMRDAAFGVVFCKIGLLIRGRTVAVGVVALLVDLKGAIVEGGFSEVTGDPVASNDSTVLVSVFVELVAVKGLEVNDDEGELEDILFDVDVITTEDVGLGGDISFIAFGLLEDMVDEVDVLG
jgi:hypothetical protein